MDVVLPLWLIVALVAVALIAVLDRLLMPSVRWFFRRRISRAIDEVNTRLKISLRPFQLTKRQVLLDRLVYDTDVAEAITAYSEAQGVPREVAHEQVVEYAKEIIPAFNAYVYFRLGYWISKKFARLLFRVHVGFEQERRLSDIDEEAAVVFVMNHRSNMDYLLVTYLVAEQSTLSYAVGEWARVWPLRTLIKAMGAFFVRRNSGDALYRKVLERYVHMATQEGVCQAVFIEGGLSHDGLLRPPRLGFLDYMLRDYDPQRAKRDITFVPVAINYDRVLEDRSLLRRRDPGVEKRSAWFVAKTVYRFWRKSVKLSARDRRRRFGFASVNFGEPVSLKKYCENGNLDFRAMERGERFQEVERLAKGLLDAIAHVMPVLPVPLIAAVFRKSQGRALTAFEVQARVYRLIDEMQERGAPIRDDERPKERTLALALTTLRYRGMVVQTGDTFSVNGENRDLLDFYANSIAHWTERQTARPSDGSAAQKRPVAPAETEPAEESAG